MGEPKGLGPKGWWTRRGGRPNPETGCGPGMGAEGWGPEGWEAKISLLFFLLPHPFSFFFLSLGIFSSLFFLSRMFSRVFFPLSGGSSRGILVVFWSRPTKTPPKIPREDPQREEKKHEKTSGERKKRREDPQREKIMKMWAGEGKKKREIFGGPAKGGPAEGGPAEVGPNRPGHPKIGLATKNSARPWPKLAKATRVATVGPNRFQTRSWPNKVVARVGLAKVGLAKVGHSPDTN